MEQKIIDINLYSFFWMVADFSFRIGFSAAYWFFMGYFDVSTFKSSTKTILKIFCAEIQKKRKVFIPHK